MTFGGFPAPKRVAAIVALSGPSRVVSKEIRMRLVAATRWLCLLGTVCLAGGCANLVETRAIEKFAKGLKDQDLETLRQSSSPTFEQKALRMTAAIDDLKILRIPDGKATIVEVEEVNESRKKVTVELDNGEKKSKDKKSGTPKKEVFYELVKDQHGQWVVDDVYLKQKKKGRDRHQVGHRTDGLVADSSRISGSLG